MPYIIIDTEGTGIFETKTREDGSVPRSDEPHQPRMAEYAHVLVDDDFNIEETYQQYVYPVGWINPDGSPMLEMPPKAFEKNHLSMEFLYQNGQPVEIALRLYLLAVKGRAFVGFNQQHDGRQIRGELRRAGLPDEFRETPSTCVMRSMQAAKIRVQKLNGKGGFPRLIDAAAHYHVPDYEEERHHRALDDAMATYTIAKHLWQHNKLLPPEVHYNKAMGEQA